MRINKFIALVTGMGRRPADTAISQGRVYINGVHALPGQDITLADEVSLDGHVLDASHLTAESSKTTILLFKPKGYVVSRNGQGSKTIYDLLPPSYWHLKPIGRLDKDSSGLLLLTNDGQLAHELTHPSREKVKIYEICLNKPLQPLHQQMISEYGLKLDDGPSKLGLERLHDDNNMEWRVTMHEGRNRQIRRTFAALGYTVVKLHRIQFGNYLLSDLGEGEWRSV